MAGIPHQSRLTAFEQEILDLRRRRPPTPYRQVLRVLRQKHGVRISLHALYSFVQVRKNLGPAPPLSWGMSGWFMGKTAANLNVNQTGDGSPGWSESSTCSPRQRCSSTWQCTSASPKLYWANSEVIHPQR